MARRTFECVLSFLVWTAVGCACCSYAWTLALMLSFSGVIYACGLTVWERGGRVSLLKAVSLAVVATMVVALSGVAVAGSTGLRELVAVLGIALVAGLVMGILCYLSVHIWFGRKAERSDEKSAAVNRKASIWEVVIVITIIVVLARMGTTDSYYLGDRYSILNLLKIKRSAAALRRNGSALSYDEAYGAVTAASWGTYEVSLSGASDNWAIVCTPREEKWHEGPLMRIAGMGAHEKPVCTLSSTNLAVMKRYPSGRTHRY